MIATGTFEVDLQPLTPYCAGRPEAPMMRFSIDKSFSGDLSARSLGEMLSAGNPANGSGGYVAIEEVEGSLGGRRGSFALQHFGVLDHGQQQLTLQVVPGSGTGELAGLSGQMAIIIEEGRHSYSFEYHLPDR